MHTRAQKTKQLGSGATLEVAKCSNLCFQKEERRKDGKRKGETGMDWKREREGKMGHS